jgi:hypothetical protein
MMRYQFRLRLDHLQKPGLQQVGHVLMDLLPRTAQQRRIGGILNQGVFEEVAGPRGPPAPVQQFRLDQLGEPGLHRFLVL